MDVLAKNELWFALVVLVLLIAFGILYGFTFARVTGPCAACKNDLTGKLQHTRSCKLSELQFGGKPVEPLRQIDVELWADPSCPEKGFAARLSSGAFLTPVLHTKRFIATAAPTFVFSQASPTSA